MKYLFVLSGENIPLAKAEVMNLLGLKKSLLHGNLLLAEVSKSKLPLLCRLALTRSIYSFIFSCSSENLSSCISNFDWNLIYEDNFCIRVHDGIKLTEKEIASLVWRKLDDPSVRLNNSKTEIHFFLADKVYACKLIMRIENDFISRRASNRPRNHPSAISPKLARALINLSGARNGRVHDLFCGAGGILIEAGLMGLTPIGQDIDEEMLERAKANLSFFKITNYRLMKENALNFHGTLSYLVSDLPYGRNTRQKDIQKLYADFLIKLASILKKRAILVLPIIHEKEFNHQSIVENSGLKLTHKFTVYVHKTLSRQILVIETIS